VFQLGPQTCFQYISFKFSLGEKLIPDGEERGCTFKMDAKLCDGGVVKGRLVLEGGGGKGAVLKGPLGGHSERGRVNTNLRLSHVPERRCLAQYR
jgi:hypothetical protein